MDALDIACSLVLVAGRKNRGREAETGSVSGFVRGAGMADDYHHHDLV